MRHGKTLIAGLCAALALATTSCTSDGNDQRKALQAAKAQGPTLEKANLEEKRRREENPNAIGYLYLMNYGQVVGYYIIKGKLSSNGSQATPEQAIVDACDHGQCDHQVVDGPQDDGSYGAPDPGVFFFLADGTKVVTSLDYVQSDRPIETLNVPKLGG